MHCPLTGFVYAKADGTWGVPRSNSAGGGVVGKTFNSQAAELVLYYESYGSDWPNGFSDEQQSFLSYQCKKVVKIRPILQ